MNREIKFRAWDKKAKRMIMLEQMKIVFDEEYWEPTGFECSSSKIRRSAKNSEFFLLQFTGLHDKNGKEIYEGDIVKDADGELREVIWYHAGFYFKYRETKEREDALIDTMTCEVVGNVYQDTEIISNERKENP